VFDVATNDAVLTVTNGDNDNDDGGAILWLIRK
jgi:hypothetical protein